MTTELHGSLDGRGLRIGIVAARFNERVVRPMVDGDFGRGCVGMRVVSHLGPT